MSEYFKIKDVCRHGLLKHLEKACTKLPGLDNPDILDIGCGSGVPTLWFAEKFSGNITAIDSDPEAIDYLRQKIQERYLQNHVRAVCLSIDDLNFKTDSYDMILAEGFLNIVGFETGFKNIHKLLKKDGYLVVHDEYKDHERKLEFIRSNKCTTIDTLLLDETIWWNDYYKQLENEINKINNLEIKERFESDMAEINYYKMNPSLFKSIYYIIMKN
jgi:cyclopropane fatty-acyl-phospholipid synthase-like methyltransferase